MSDLSYWEEIICQAADDYDISLTKEQLTALADAASSGHEHYSQAFYSPSWSDRFDEIDRDWRRKYEELRAEFIQYQGYAEKAYVRGAKLPSWAKVTIDKYGVTRYD